jgi:hypothetical protein
MPTSRSGLALAAAAALLLAGCGDAKEEKPAAAEPTATAAAGLAIPEYEREVNDIIRRVNDARSDYFNGSDAKAAVRRQTVRVRAAYRRGAEQLEAIEPPPAAADAQARVIRLWNRREAQVAAILDAPRFDPSKISDLLYGTDSDAHVYDPLYMLP